MTSPATSLPETIVRSRFTHVVRIENGGICLHAIRRTRVVIRPDVVAILEALAVEQPAAAFVGEHARDSGIAEPLVEACLHELIGAGFVFAGTESEETAQYERLARALLAGDPAARADLDAGGEPRTMDRYSFLRVPRDVASFAPLARQAAVLVLGFCDVHFASDLLRDEARHRGIDLHVDAVFEMDAKAAGERAYDFVIVGALAARHGHWYRTDGEGDLSPSRYLRSARSILERLRDVTGAPILIHNLPVPTLSPGGFSDALRDGPARRARAIHEGLLALAAGMRDVHVVDVDAALSRVGKLQTLDDRLVPGSHLGGIGWWALLPGHELRSVHGLPLRESVADAFSIRDPLLFDRTIAGEQLAWIQTLLGVGRRKCVIVDLDDTLWPGVLAETGSPFPEDLDYTLFSYHSIYLGLHQALRALKSRGILLACVSKNDEEVVRSLWRYPPAAPRELLVTPEDLVTWRVNWDEKTDNILRIAQELNLGLDSLVFIDDHPVERDKVRRFLPEVLVLGDSMLSLRAQLLSMPALQVAHVTAEAESRTEMTRSQILRERMRETASDESEYRRSLEIHCHIAQLGPDDDLERVHELIVRTNQFNTTGWRIPKHELQAILREEQARLHVLGVTDRFTSYGLVGACLVRGERIELFVMSCRVIGLGVEHSLLRAAILASDVPVVRARIFPTARNLPVRNLFRDHGFSLQGEDWCLERGAVGALPPIDPALTVSG